MLLEVSTEHGEIETDEREMLYKVFDFAEKEVADVMLPGPTSLASPSTSLRTRRWRQCSGRLHALPVYRETLDDIVGILQSGPGLSLHNGGGGMVALADLLRAPYVVPETKDLGALLARSGARASTWPSWWTSTAQPPAS